MMIGMVSGWGVRGKSAEEKVAAGLVVQGVWFFSLLYFALIRLTRVIFSQDTYRLLSYGEKRLGCIIEDTI